MTRKTIYRFVDILDDNIPEDGYTIAISHSPKTHRSPNIVTLGGAIVCDKKYNRKQTNTLMKKRFHLHNSVDEGSVVSTFSRDLDRRSCKEKYSGSSALDRCYVGGKGFSRFLKNHLNIEANAFLATTASAGPYSIGSYNNDSSRRSPENEDGGRLGGPAGGVTGSVTDRTGERTSERRAGGGGRGKDGGGGGGQNGEARPSSRKQSRQSQQNIALIANGKGQNGYDKGEGRERTSSELIKDSTYLNGTTSRLKGDDASSGVLPPATGPVKNTNVTAVNNNGSGNYTNGFRPLNTRNNFLGGQQITPTLPSSQQQRAQVSSTSSSYSRDSEDLVATGTNPLNPAGPGAGGAATVGGRRGVPNMPQQQSGPGQQSLENGAGPGSSLHSSQSSGALAVGPERLGVGSGPSRKGYSGGGSSKGYPGPVMGMRGLREQMAEPKYADPSVGAPPSFQQRLAEIGSLEQETIRYERAKKFKKKTKPET